MTTHLEPSGSAPAGEGSASGPVAGNGVAPVVTEASGGNPLRLAPILETLQLVAAPTSLIAALLFYFGWEFTNARLLYFGLDQSLLGFSAQDYLLRSFDPVVLPLSTMLVTAVVLVWSHSRFRGWIALGVHLRALEHAATVLSATGLLLFALAVTTIAGHPVVTLSPILTPLNLGMGVGTATYGGRLRSWVFAARGDSRKPRGRSARSSTVITTLVAALVTLSLFGATGQWARAYGLGRARQLARNLDSRRPSAVVYSKQRLQVAGPGVRVDGIGDEESLYRFRYSGLKLLIRADTKFFLLPLRWAPGRGTAIVLPDDKTVRVEYVPGLSTAQ